MNKRDRQTLLPPGTEHARGDPAARHVEAARTSLLRLRRRYGKRISVQLPFQPPFVILSDPADIKELFMAPPDAVHPGEGARVLEPLIGRNSVILLDEAPHLEQRKLMLPAFHGEKMQRLTGTMTELAERELDSWPRDVSRWRCIPGCSGSRSRSSCAPSSASRRGSGSTGCAIR